MTIKEAIALIEANPGPGFTPMPKHEYLGTSGEVLIRVCEQGSVYVLHPHSQYVETAVDFAIVFAEISAEAWRLTFEDAVKPRGSS